MSESLIALHQLRVANLRTAMLMLELGAPLCAEPVEQVIVVPVKDGAA